MADVTLTVYDISRSTGVNLTDNGTAGTNANTYYFQNDGRVILLLNSTAGATITVPTPNTVDGCAITDLTITAGAAKTQGHGPFPPSIYNDANGKVSFTLTANTTIMAVRV